MAIWLAEIEKTHYEVNNKRIRTLKNFNDWDNVKAVTVKEKNLVFMSKRNAKLWLRMAGYNFEYKNCYSKHSYLSETMIYFKKITQEEFDELNIDNDL